MPNIPGSMNVRKMVIAMSRTMLKQSYRTEMNNYFTLHFNLHLHFILIYRDFKKFSEETFNEELTLKLTNECVNNYSSFENIFLDTLNHHAPVKKKLVRANHAPYVTKTLRKAIMGR